MANKAPRTILGQDLFAQFIKAGIVPSNCRRMVIDMEVEKAVRVYYDCFGDERLLEVEGLVSMLGDITSTTAAALADD